MPVPLIVRLLPVKSKASAKVMVPAKVVVPVPATCVKLLALTVLLKPTLPAFVTVILPSALRFPTALRRAMLPPVPAFRVRF